MIEIHTTCKNLKDAETISKLLLKEKFAACASYFEIESHFAWKGKISKGKEIMLIIKTNAKQKDNAIKLIKSNHSYELPIITWNEVNTTKDAKDWINSSV